MLAVWPMYLLLASVGSHTKHSHIAREAQRGCRIHPRPHSNWFQATWSQKPSPVDLGESLARPPTSPALAEDGVVDIAFLAGLPHGWGGQS